ncbi:MAG: C1 family peptidase [Saprospiraceae bacterium]|nr:C1 family peptidase [Saprospiraceae bacterium]
MKTFKLFTLLSFFFILASCGKDDMNTPDNPMDDPTNPTETEYTLGWFGDDNVGSVPVSTNFGFGNGNLPTSYDIVDKFPPMGDQGNYGTCVAWAVGYNTKTALSGMDRNLSASDLSSPQNQFSPKDLFTALPDNLKGAECNGTNFANALTLLQERGVATMATVPYTNLGQCYNSSTEASWTSEAANYKIKYWRKIEASATSIKQNVSNNIPVILGARLADNFMSWNSDNVLSSHSSFTQVGIHSYHAMVIAGYDDNKGPNGAFRVINSWGEGWGDRGYIWIDYNFLIEEFGVNSLGENSLFIAANQDGDVAPPDDDPTPTAQGVDMAPWVFADYSTYDWSGISNEREIEFNLYNIGTQDARPESNWNVYYIYYNAYDANDYGIMFYDEFNQSIPAETWECPTAENCIVNTTIPAGGDFATNAFGMSSIARTYNVPFITGEYYLLMVADATDVFMEQDEQNNLFYTSIDPVYFQNGYAFVTQNDDDAFGFTNENKEGFSSRSAVQTRTPQNGNFKNAYTGDEIIDLLKQEKRNGGLAKKLNEFQSAQQNVKMYSNPNK